MKFRENMKILTLLKDDTEIIDNKIVAKKNLKNLFYLADLVIYKDKDSNKVLILKDRFGENNVMF